MTRNHLECVAATCKLAFHPVLELGFKVSCTCENVLVCVYLVCSEHECVFVFRYEVAGVGFSWCVEKARDRWNQTESSERSNYYTESVV